MGDQSEELVRDVYQAFGRGDVPTVLGAMAADIEWHEAEGMPYGGVYHGGEAVVQNVFGPIMQTSRTSRSRRRSSSRRETLSRRSSATQGPGRPPARSLTSRSCTSGRCATARSSSSGSS